MTAACMRELSCAGEVTKTGFILCAPLFLYAVTQGKARLPLILRTFMKRDSCWRAGKSRITYNKLRKNKEDKVCSLC